MVRATPLLALVILTGIAGGCRDPQALALLQISGDQEYANVTLAVEARAWSVYRSLASATVPAQSTGSWLQVGLYLPAPAHGAVGIDVTASEDTGTGPCVVGVGYTTATVPDGQTSPPTPLLVVEVQSACHDAGFDTGQVRFDGAVAGGPDAATPDAAEPDAGDAGGDL